VSFGVFRAPLQHRSFVIFISIFTALLIWQSIILIIFFGKLLGLLVFRWLFAWIEDINEFDKYFMIWFMIVVFFSKPFREMSDRE
jgi:hypothetical protein